ncbi:hypothetical protein TruAng_008790 [Truncatella angustata]|nr:hypothetical protein TruAng_008790 [Truncatella angustata]
MPSPKLLIIAALGVAEITVATSLCQNITIPVTISAENTPLNFAPPLTNFDATNFLLNSLKAIRDGVQNPQTTTISGIYNLAATRCDPESGPSDVLQILTHGFGFDRSYWDFPFNDHNYSYVNFALDHGYSTLSWDRLGLGMSSHGDPINEIQIPLEVAALGALSRVARTGNLSSTGTSYGKIAHIGHSLGSAMIYALAATDPDMLDAIVLTGFSHFVAYQPVGLIGFHLVQANTIDGFTDYVPGYLAQKDTIAVQTDFFAPGSFDPEILDAAFLAQAPITVGELATAAYMGNATIYSKAPVLIATGGKNNLLKGNGFVKSYYYGSIGR